MDPRRRLVRVAAHADPLAVDEGDGTALGPGRTLDLVEHAYDAAGSYALTLTLGDGDGGTATWTEKMGVGAGLRFSASGAISAANEDGESPYLTVLPVVRDGQRIRFAGDLGAAARGDPAADAGAPCLVSFGSRAPTIGSELVPCTVVRFGGLFPNGLREGTYPVAVVRNERPFEVYDTFEADLEETLGVLDLLNKPGPPQLRPAATAAGASRDAPLIDFENPELTVRFS